MSPHALEEGNNVIHGRRRDKFPVIKPKTYPEVVHEYGETDHHRCDTPRTTELITGGMPVSVRAAARCGVLTFDVGPRVDRFYGLHLWLSRRQVSAVCRRFVGAAHC